MAVGTVSSISDDVWQLISTTTINSGTSATVATGLSGAYKELMVVWRAVTTGTNCGLAATFNADTTANNYGVTTGWQGGYFEVINNYVPLTGYSAYTTHYSGFMKVKNANQTIPHTLEGGGWVTNFISGAYLPVTPATINSIEFKTSNGTSAFTGGTVLVYGIPA